jgi:DNA replication protein DnaC
MKMSPKIGHELTQYLKELCLPTIRAIYDDEALRAERESVGYREYLLGLAKQECEARRQHRIERFLQESRLPLEKSLESFDLKRLPERLRQQVRTLLEGSFLDRRENLLAFGNPGSGKTHLLAAVCQELIRTQGRRIYFTKCQALVEGLLNNKRDLKLDRAVKRLGKFEALFIDDIGYVQQSREEMEVLFTLLAERYERGSLLVTSNLPFSKWETIFKDPMTTAAAIDRLVHHSIILEMNLPSYRMEIAKKSRTVSAVRSGNGRGVER